MARRPAPEIQAGLTQPKKKTRAPAGAKGPKRPKREHVSHSERREVRSVVTSKPERPRAPLPELPDTANTRGRERARIEADVRRRYPHQSAHDRRRDALLGFLVGATKSGLKADWDYGIKPNIDLGSAAISDIRSQFEDTADILRHPRREHKPTPSKTLPILEGSAEGAAHALRHPREDPLNTALAVGGVAALALGGTSAVRNVKKGSRSRRKPGKTVKAAPPEQVVGTAKAGGSKKGKPASEDKVASVLPEAQKVRGVQEAAWRPVRGERFSKTRKEFGGAGGGRAGHYAATGQLKGELPKVPFNRLREIGYSKKELDRDVDRIYEHPELMDGEAISAAQGLIDMAENSVVPQAKQIELMNRVFGPEKTKRLVMKSVPGEVIGMARSLMTTLDLSLNLRQALPLLFRNPKLWARSIGPQVKAMGSEAKFQTSREARFADPDYQELQRVQPGLLTDIEGSVGSRSEYYPSTFAEKLNVPIPGTKNVPLVRGRVGPGRVVRASGRAFETGQDMNILNSYKAMKARARKWGVNIDPHTPEGLKELKGMAEVAGAQTGRGIFKSDLGKKSQPLLSKGLFAPSFYKSRLTWFSPRWYVKLPKVARYEALRTVGQFLGGAAGILYGASKIAGVDVANDPRSTDFAKIKIGDTRLDVLGGFQQYTRLAAQIATGKYVDTETGEVIDMKPGIGNRTRWDTLMNFATSKASPPASFIIDLFKGTDYQHRPFEWKRAVVQRMTPLVLQDMLTVYGHTGSIPAAAAAYAGAGAGIGVQTYTRTSADEKARQEWQTRTEARWKKLGHAGPLPLALVRKYENGRLVSKALADTKKELGLERVDDIPVKDQAKAYVAAVMAANPRLKQYQAAWLDQIDAADDLDVEKELLPALRRRLGLNVQIADLRE